jgi:AcrR family transcriptional regulator
MGKRAAAVEETRRRIVDATRALHAERGIAATSWEDIAHRAGVGVGTVYRHFPSVDELIPACGRASMQVIALPDPMTTAALFEGAHDAMRIRRLVGEAYAIYERGASELRVARLERDVHPAVTQTAEDLEASLQALTDAALEPLGCSEADGRLVRAMLDLGTWDALRAHGLGPAEAVATVADMLARQLLAR